MVVTLVLSFSFYRFISSLTSFTSTLFLVLSTVFPKTPSFVNLKTTFSKVFRASLVRVVLWQKCSYLRWAWREHFSPCESLDKHVLHEMGLSNIFLWSLSRRIVLFEFQFLSLDLLEFSQGFWCFPYSIDKRLLYYKHAGLVPLRVLCVLFMCFRGRFKGFVLTYLLSADQQWLSFQMSLSVFLPPN